MKGKIRGQKRKLRVMERRLQQATQTFPSTFYRGIFSVKAPASQALLGQLSIKGQKQVAAYFMDGATRFLQMERPRDTQIVLLLFPKNMWRSEIIIFEQQQDMADFFEQHTLTGFWREQEIAAHFLPLFAWEQKQLLEQQQPIFCYIERKSK